MSCFPSRISPPRLQGCRKRRGGGSIGEGFSGSKRRTANSAAPLPRRDYVGEVGLRWAPLASSPRRMRLQGLVEMTGLSSNYDHLEYLETVSRKLLPC